MTIRITEKEGKTLLNIARTKISQQLSLNKNDIKKKTSKNNVFYEKRGIFVTLYKNDGLRGCIGTLEPSECIIDGIKNNAVNAAFQDPRFPQLKPDEFNEINIEISILTKPEKLDYTDYNDLLSKLKPHIHGVIIQKNNHKATFLPQVWDQLPKADDFLSHLCQKAGLASDEWKTGNLEVMIYQVQYFKEK
jgi:AmmeMemoRadiSam system protein A